MHFNVARLSSLCGSFSNALAETSRTSYCCWRRLNKLHLSVAEFPTFSHRTPILFPVDTVTSLGVLKHPPRKSIKRITVDVTGSFGDVSVESLLLPTPGGISRECQRLLLANEEGPRLPHSQARRLNQEWSQISVNITNENGDTTSHCQLL